ncbi:hypothetical protein [Thiomonas sp. 13-64-67]|uniref:hypothetical protein n=1 Tax=Thiomonas sp. 13-64-67 TaxID=1970447 RepID=UPI00257CB050|nr:hypothetical protein [Thiomonas sp. 13-64-67]
MKGVVAGAARGGLQQGRELALRLRQQGRQGLLPLRPGAQMAFVKQAAVAQRAGQQLRGLLGRLGRVGPDRRGCGCRGAGVRAKDAVIRAGARGSIRSRSARRRLHLLQQTEQLPRAGQLRLGGCLRRLLRGEQKLRLAALRSQINQRQARANLECSSGQSGVHQGVAQPQQNLRLQPPTRRRCRQVGRSGRSGLHLNHLGLERGARSGDKRRRFGPGSARRPGGRDRRNAAEDLRRVHLASDRLLAQVNDELRLGLA